MARDAARFEGKERAVPPADAVADPADSAQEVADATGLTVFGADGATTGKFVIDSPESENRIARWYTFRPGVHATQEPTAPVPASADGPARD
ncbi:hypothetical protein [Streptomyces sp. NPDC002690]